MWKAFEKSHKECVRKNTMMLKPQQRFRSKKNNVFTENVNKIAKKKKKKKKNKCNNITKQYKHF